MKKNTKIREKSILILTIIFFLFFSGCNNIDGEIEKNLSEKNINNKQYFMTDKIFFDNGISIGAHPASIKDYSYAKDLGLNINREGLYFIWSWTDSERKGKFTFKKAVAPSRNNKAKVEKIIDYDTEQEKLSIFAEIEMIRNVCPFMQGDEFNNIEEKKVYQEFVKKLVERYDGDEDLGCTQEFPDCYTEGDGEYPSESFLKILTENPIKYWQVCNQITDVCLNEKKIEECSEKYAEVQEITYLSIKESCPDCEVLIAGDSLTKMYPPIFKYLNGKYIDIIDKHYFGSEKVYEDIENGMEILKESLIETGFDLEKLKFWITETGTYSGDPVKNEIQNDLPYQSEKIQAEELIKIFTTALGSGAETVLWAWGIEEGFNCDCCIFDYTGLIYDGRNKPNCYLSEQYDKGKDVKKLAYYSLKLFTEKIINCTSVQKIIYLDSKEIYIYKFSNEDTKEEVWVAWNDVGLESISLNSLGLKSAKITQGVPDYAEGLGIEKDYITFEEMFKESIVNDYFVLGEIPVFIENNLN